MPRLQHWKQWAKAARREVHALYLAARDPRTPRWVKVFALAVVAYAVSPIDLIPDFIPILGLLDDLLLLPLGILWVRNVVPADVLAEARERAAEAAPSPTGGRIAATLIVLVWLATLIVAGAWLWRWRVMETQ